MINNLLLIILGWLFFLSYLVYKTRNHYLKLVKNTKKYHLDEILDFLLKKNIDLEKNLTFIEQELKKEINKAKFNLKKINIVRYNPFDRGGDQSFVLGIFDEENNGFILNFIYTKEGLRVYPKIVKKGEGVNYKLTDEEKKTLQNNYLLDERE